MKYMKLGSKADAFLSDGSGARYIASELPTDIVVDVHGVRFYVHKFPLLSKSGRLQKLILRASEEGDDEVHMEEFPGGPKLFEICAKFCYGITITLNAHSVAAARCAAEYLEMTEDVDKGNLIYKTEVFLTSSILHSWKDSVIALQTTRALLPWSEHLRIVGRCIDSISSKTSVDPSSVSWSYSCSKKLVSDHTSVGRESKLQQRQHAIPRDWWVEDICDLDVDLYKRVMVAVKAKGRMSAQLVTEALMSYAVRWLPDSVEKLIVSDEYGKRRRNRNVVETIIWLLPPDKGSCCSCAFLLKLLKTAAVIGIEESSKEELLSRISLQLDKASAKDLLIPSSDGTAYDVNLAHSLVCNFLMQDGSGVNCDNHAKGESNAGELVLGHASLLAVGKLVDGYLAEIAHDGNLSVSSFIDLSRLLPQAARPVHDRLYTATDIYLKEHSGLTKEEKKMICGLIDIEKLSPEARLHAAHNERLPLRMVVQILYFEQMKAASRGKPATSNDISLGSLHSTAHVEEMTKNQEAESCMSPKNQAKTVQCLEGELLTKVKISSTMKKEGRVGSLLPSRSRKFLQKLWSGKSKVNHRSSETSGSSQSPPPTSVTMVKTTSSHSYTRDRRHSVS